MDPRNILALWDNIRFGVRPSRPVWILEREKIYEGVPSLEYIRSMIDERFSANKTE